MGTIKRSHMALPNPPTNGTVLNIIDSHFQEFQIMPISIVQVDLHISSIFVSWQAQAWTSHNIHYSCIYIHVHYAGLLITKYSRLTTKITFLSVTHLKTNAA